VRILADAAKPARIILFGARRPGTGPKMVRLRLLLRPLRVPADILVFSAGKVARRGHQRGFVLAGVLFGRTHPVECSISRTTADSSHRRSRD
jgi:hypothetical protein